METEFRDCKILRSDPRKPDPRYVREFHKAGKDYARDGIGTGATHEKGYLPLLTLSGTDNEDGTATITLTVTDWMGNAVADAYLLQFWCSAAALGAPLDTETFAATTGRIITDSPAAVDAGFFSVSTNASGVAVLTHTASGNATYYYQVPIGNRIVAGSLAITGYS